jgi:hypothetical protein
MCVPIPGMMGMIRTPLWTGGVYTCEWLHLPGLTKGCRASDDDGYICLPYLEFSDWLQSHARIFRICLKVLGFWTGEFVEYGFSVGIAIFYVFPFLIV